MTKTNMTFATMTAGEALDMLVSLDAQKWGEAERDASRRMHSARSRGLLINSIVHHSINDYGDLFSAAEKKLAKAQLTAADKAELRRGG